MKVPIKQISILSALALLGASPALAGVGLVRSGGVLGQSVQYDVTGDPGELFALLPSTTVGPTPLSIIDPLDGRSLDLGLGLVSLLTTGPLDATGAASVSFPLPLDPTLSGLPLYAQVMTIPGAVTLVDEISARNGFTLGLPGESFLGLGELSVATAGYGSALLLDGTVLLGGGSVDDGAGNSIPSSALRLFDPQTQTFSDLAASLPVPVTAPAVVGLGDGRVLFCGGLGANDTVLSSAAIFDPVTGTATAVASMPGPRAQHTATLLLDGRVFVTGGVKAINAADPISGLGDVLKTSAIFDPVAGSWSSAASLSLPRIGHNASLLPSGKVLITGGLEVASLFGIPIPSIINGCKRYNPSNNTMQSTPSFSGSRALHSQLTLSDGRVLVVGGADGDVLTQNFFSLATCRVYSEGSNSWSNVTSLPEVRTFPSLVELAGRVHVISGLGTIDVLTLTGAPVTSIASGDLTTFSWQAQGQMVYPRPLSSAVAIDAGERVLVLGPGDNGLPGTDDLTAEVYIP